MYLAQRRGEESLRLSELSWEREQDCCWITEDGLLCFPWFLRRPARPASPTPTPYHPPPTPGQLFWPHTELQVSWRELFWVRSILACLPVCTTECCRIREGWDLRLVADTMERGSFPLSGDSLSHRPSF